VARRYELKRRAERQEETKRRIVDATIELHSTKGPALTTFSDIARRAGVQRHTLYRYFPTERDLGYACSGHYMEENPPPDASAWREIADPRDRVRHGLDELYGWFEQNRAMLSCVFRDAEFHPLTREMFELRASPAVGAIRAALAEDVDDRRRLVLLDLALDFHTWRRLAAGGLTRSEAAEVMTAAIFCA
jgi:AcrR family transcriptional regulator